jgi:hypothetical protein
MWSTKSRPAPLRALLLFGLLLSSCPQGRSPAPAERLFDAIRRDLGGIRAESDYKATYRITNTTSHPVSVTGIKTSCGCVVANHDPSEIAPGGYRDIVLNLSTHGQTVLGPLVKHAVVEFGSGEKVDLTLAARLESDFELEPRRLEFSADQKTHKLSVIRRLLDAKTFTRLVLVAQSERYDVIEDASSATDRRDFRITLKEASAGMSLPEIYFAAEPGGKPLPFSTVVCTRTGPTLRPSAFVVVVGETASMPPAQRFELIDFQSQPMQLTTVEAFDEQSRRVLNVSFEPAQDKKSFSIALAQAPSTSMTNLFVSVHFEAVDGSVAGRLLLPCHIVTTPAAKAPANSTRGAF